MLDGLFRQNSVLGQAAKAAALRNEVYMSNIANNDTPGYKARVVEFENAFKNALSSQKDSVSVKFSNDIAKVSIDKKNYSMRLDGNNIDIESQMAELYKNSSRYEILLNSMNANSQVRSLIYNR